MSPRQQRTTLRAVASLALPLLALSSVASSSSVADEASGWRNVEQISTAAQSYSQVVLPTFQGHLADSDLPDPFSHVHVVSAWVDQRPRREDLPPDIAMIASLRSGDAGPQEGKKTNHELDKLPGNHLLCYIAARPRWHLGTPREPRYSIAPSVVGLLDRRLPDAEEEDFATIISCSLGSKYDVASWDDYDVYVALSTDAIAPPPESFVAAQLISLPDEEMHAEGEGTMAMCMQPLSGDAFAPFMEDFIDYYRALGFTLFMPYLLDPGRKTLDVLSRAGSGMEAVRWTAPLAWQKSYLHDGRARQSFAVSPSSWNLTGVAVLPSDVEATVGMVLGPRELTARGSLLAENDCLLRAMHKGARWVAFVDWDEYLLLRPPTGQWPLLNGGSPSSRLSTYFRGLDAKAWSMVIEAHEPFSYIRPISPFNDTLAPAYLFSNSDIQGNNAPAGVPEYLDDQNLSPDTLEAWTPLIFVSTVRNKDWELPGRHSQFILDPWAWWTLLPHFPNVPYAHFVASDGACSRRSCRKDGASFASRFGEHSGVVPVLGSGNSAGHRTGTGASFRLHIHEQLGVVQQGARKGVESAVAKLSTWERIPATTWKVHRSLVEDWTMASTMRLHLPALRDPSRHAGGLVEHIQHIQEATQGYAMPIGAGLSFLVMVVLSVVAWRYTRKEAVEIQHDEDEMRQRLLSTTSSVDM